MPGARFARRSDIPAVGALMERLGLGAGVEVLEHDWTSRPGFVLERDAWVVPSDEGVDGYGVLYPGGWAEMATVTADLYPSLLHRIEHRAAEAGEGLLRFLVPADGTLQEFLGSRSFEEEDRYVDLTIDLTARARPPTMGVDIRAAHTDVDQRTVFELVIRAYRDEPDFDRWRSWITTWTFDADLWLLSPADGAPTAALVGWAFPDRGWVKRVALDPNEPDLEAGMGLLQHAFDVIGRKGLPAVGLPVAGSDPTYLQPLCRRAGMSEGRALILLARSTDLR